MITHADKACEFPFWKLTGFVCCDSVLYLGVALLNLSRPVEISVLSKDEAKSSKEKVEKWGVMNECGLFN